MRYAWITLSNLLLTWVELVCLQISNEAESSSEDAKSLLSQLQSGVIHIRELSFQASGSERTDPSFIHRLHRPDVPIETSDARVSCTLPKSH